MGQLAHIEASRITMEQERPNGNHGAVAVRVQGKTRVALWKRLLGIYGDVVSYIA
jgi:hypothetical protein